MSKIVSFRVPQYSVKEGKIVISHRASNIEDVKAAMKTLGVLESEKYTAKQIDSLFAAIPSLFVDVARVIKAEAIKAGKDKVAKILKDKDTK